MIYTFLTDSISLLLVSTPLPISHFTFALYTTTKTSSTHRIYIHVSAMSDHRSTTPSLAGHSRNVSTPVPKTATSTERHIRNISMPDSMPGSAVERMQALSLTRYSGILMDYMTYPRLTVFFTQQFPTSRGTNRESIPPDHHQEWIATGEERRSRHSKRRRNPGASSSQPQSRLE